MGNINGKKVLQVVRTVEAGGVEIDDTTTALDKVWSSQKTSDLISVNSDKGIYYTTVAPTESNGNYTLAVSDLANPNQYTQQFYNNLVLYIDSSNNVTELYKVTGVNGSKTTLTLSKVGNFGGGGIPTITIEQSQMISQNEIQLTQEQYDLLSTNGVVNVDLMGMQLLGMVSNNASNGTNIELMCNVYDNGIAGQNNASIIVYAISVVKSTMIATFYQNSFGKAKQLYQHNVRIQFGSSGYYELFIQITNDNPNIMFTDKASIVQYLIDNGHSVESGKSNMDTNLLKASGRVRNVSSSTYDIKQVEGIYHRISLNNSIFAVGYGDSTSFMDYQITEGINDLTIKEFVEPL